MHILTAHNFYKEAGGEDVVFQAETSMLRRYGHVVSEFCEFNVRVNEIGLMEAATKMVWSHETKKRMVELLARDRPQIVHFHNIFFLISPSAYDACSKMGIPVVQTLHNYRLVCPAAIQFRDGMICEECVGRTIPWPGVLHGCWRGSRTQTGAVALMLSVHNLIGTWRKHVDVYVAVSQFVRKKLIEGGLPAEKIVVKPNFVHPDPGVGVPGQRRERCALFVGRLSPEKGVRTLLRPWRQLRGIPLKIVGDGPLMEEVRSFIAQEGLKDVEVIGRRPREEVLRRMREARPLVFPSEWYEGFPMTIVEAFACGVPVVASRLGSMTEIVADGRTGLLFEPGNAEDLAAKVEWAWTHEKEMAEMGKEARREYELKYTAERNYQMLMEVYDLAIQSAKKRYGSRVERR